MRVLVTGGCGFIGSHFVRLCLRKYPDLELVNLDKLTYAANPRNLDEVADDPRYSFVQGDIADPEVVSNAMRGCTHVVNFAAESHVDRSIQAGAEFIHTDVLGTYVLLNAAREAGVQKFVQVSTDEVYGSTRAGSFTETDALAPSSPYSASKAGGDLQVLAFMETHGMQACITRGSNTYGPNQYPEKLIPLFVTNAIDEEPLPVYGKGDQVRDWIYVEDHCSGVETVLFEGVPGEIYNISAGNERENLWITHQILELSGRSDELIRYVEDRPGHDFRYSIDSSKLRALGWKPATGLEDGLRRTVQWYTDNEDWWRPIKSGDFREFYERQYGQRLEAVGSPN